MNVDGARRRLAAAQSFRKRRQKAAAAKCHVQRVQRVAQVARDEALAGMKLARGLPLRTVLQHAKCDQALFEGFESPEALFDVAHK